MKASNSLILTAATILLVTSGCGTKKANLSENETKPKTVSTSYDDNLAKIEQAVKIARLNDAKDSFIICNINDAPITLGDYRRQLRAQEEQTQAALGFNPQTKTELLNVAHEKGISLTESEKQQLIAKATAVSGGKSAFSKLLKENKLTQKDFDQEVLDVGLACKAAKSIIEENLMRQLINRELLCEAAKENGFSKQALNKYNEVKKSPQYDKMVVNSGLSDAAVQNELCKNELCQLMIAKIVQDKPVTEAEIKKFYDENKSKLQHGTRVRLSQILIAAPANDQASIKSFKAELHKANPKLTTAEINAKIAEIFANQKEKAVMILGEARTGANFVQLANQYTEDEPARAAKNGGDMGYQDEKQLVKPFWAKIQTVKVGGILPELVQSSLGYHIIKLTDRQNAGPISFAECKDQIKELLGHQKSSISVDQWLSSARQKAKLTESSELAVLAPPSPSPPPTSQASTKTTSIN